jgi:hypothetical protein
MNNVEVVYTSWSNLKKAPSMDVGQVGFHNPRLVINLGPHYYYFLGDKLTIRLDKYFGMSNNA